MIQACLLLAATLFDPPTFNFPGGSEHEFARYVSEHFEQPVAMLPEVGRRMPPGEFVYASEEATRRQFRHLFGLEIERVDGGIAIFPMSYNPDFVNYNGQVGKFSGGVSGEVLETENGNLKVKYVEKAYFSLVSVSSVVKEDYKVFKLYEKPFIVLHGEFKNSQSLMTVAAVALGAKLIVREDVKSIDFDLARDRKLTSGMANRNYHDASTKRLITYASAVLPSLTEIELRSGYIGNKTIDRPLPSGTIIEVAANNYIQGKIESILNGDNEGLKATIGNYNIESNVNFFWHGAILPAVKLHHKENGIPLVL